LQWHRPFSTVLLVSSGARRRPGFVSRKVGASLLDTSAPLRSLPA